MTRDAETVRTRTTAVDVLRLTPLQDGVPDHGWAATWTLTSPLLLCIVAQYAVPEFRPESYREWRSPGLAGMTACLADEDFRAFREHDVTQAVHERAHHHAATGVAVETWTGERTADDSPPRRWLYNLLPRWTWCPPDDWPEEESPTRTIHTAGRITPNPAHTWPDRPPYGQGPPPPSGNTYCLTAVTEIPPPPAGYAHPALAAWATR